MRGKSVLFYDPRSRCFCRFFLASRFLVIRELKVDLQEPLYLLVSLIESSWSIMAIQQPPVEEFIGDRVLSKDVVFEILGKGEHIIVIQSPSPYM